MLKPGSGINNNKNSRRSIRKSAYDYSAEGMYFITICTYKMHDYIFGEVVNDEMQLNAFGMIAYAEWLKLPERFPGIELDEFIVMPNHVHGIIIIKKQIISLVGAPLAVARDDKDIDLTNENASGKKATARVAPTVGNMVGAYKSLVFKRCLELFKEQNNNYPKRSMGKIWQRNYYEHIIRDGRAYQLISDYIVNNPRNWNQDRYKYQNIG